MSICLLLSTIVSARSFDLFLPCQSLEMDGQVELIFLSTALSFAYAMRYTPQHMIYTAHQNKIKPSSAKVELNV